VQVPKSPILSRNMKIFISNKTMDMKIGIILTFTVLVLGLVACKGGKKATTTDKEMKENSIGMDMAAGTGEIFAEMRKSSCFGKCPVYTLKIMDNGRVEYHGVIHTEKMGIYSRMLPVDSFNQITRAIVETNLWQYEDNYNSGATDFPITTITHHRKDSSKVVKGDFERPEAVRQLEKKLIAIADSGEWRQEEMLVPYDAIPGEIIVELIPEADEKSLENHFADQGLKIKSKIAPNLNLWLYTFEEEKISAGRIGVLIKEYRGVKAVDFNKKLDSRR